MHSRVLPASSFVLARSRQQPYFIPNNSSVSPCSLSWRRSFCPLQYAGPRYSRSPRRTSIHAIANQAEDTEAIEMEVKVTGMTCEGCSSRVQKVLESLAGVEAAEVALDSGIAKIHVAASGQLDAFYTQLPRLVDAIRELGFEAEPHFGEYDEE